MSRSVPPNRLNAVLDVLAGMSGGCTAMEVAARLNPRPPLRNVQRCLSALVQDRKVVRSGCARSTRYRLAGPNDEADLGIDSGEPLCGLSPVPQAIQVLVSAPLAERPPVEYRRALLDAYVPNKTWYLPEDVRKLLLAAPGVQGGAAMLRDEEFRRQLVEDAALIALPLERCKASLPLVTQSLAEGRTMKNPPKPVILAVNHEDTYKHLSALLGRAKFTWDTVLDLVDYIESDIVVDAKGNMVGESALRTGPLEFAGSTYRPPADASMIRACYEQLMATAADIKDPFEQSFFTFVHLVYLQPFTLNLAMACVAANVPLLCANLLPFVFVTVSPRDILAGVLGVCELNRIDLLREAYLRAYFDNVSLPNDHPWRSR